MKLTYAHMVRTEMNVRSHFDRRVRVNRFTVAYVGEDGNEYRKSFELRSNSKNYINIPHEGENLAITNLSKQWS